MQKSSFLSHHLNNNMLKNYVIFAQGQQKQIAFHSFKAWSFQTHKYSLNSRFLSDDIFEAFPSCH